MIVIFVNLLYFSAPNGLTLCFFVTVSFPATTLMTSRHSSFLFLTFVFSPWDLYSLGHKNNNNDNDNDNNNDNDNDNTNQTQTESSMRRLNSKLESTSVYVFAV